MVIEILKKNGRIELVNSLTVKMSPHTPPLKILSIYLIEDKIMCGLRNGNDIEANGPNVINTVYQRLMLLKNIEKTIS